ncbi:MAG TPA: hypothetical protein VMB84_08555 [Stellaceae bacterium]|nr:hypothetical protein [Stellaceae bacterium]
MIRAERVVYMLARALLGAPGVAGNIVTANAAPGSEAFWEALGCVAARRGAHTHVFDRPTTPAAETDRPLP